VGQPRVCHLLAARQVQRLERSEAAELSQPRVRYLLAIDEAKPLQPGEAVQVG
jgi:hypothetical protein